MEEEKYIRLSAAQKVIKNFFMAEVAAGNHDKVNAVDASADICMALEKLEGKNEFEYLNALGDQLMDWASDRYLNSLQNEVNAEYNWKDRCIEKMLPMPDDDEDIQEYELAKEQEAYKAGYMKGIKETFEDFTDMMEDNLLFELSGNI